ncbi:DUF374 domain-containing protein [Acetobacter sp. AN02]|uniref:glycosyltransferase N-terminal domain-containing protein n=1 Tax=Acetobacter sp. AN02 TaxID=2894186 RepID=UPI0024342602|nr:glycosyltransferase N-terminal domain-containing protein [Acetobacter sp. AN02]MDG6095233.1 DUF374 domain-containing protein [Acetobacter sp. AN02]
MKTPETGLPAGLSVRAVMTVVFRRWLYIALKTTSWRSEMHPEARALLTGQEGQTALVAFWHETLPLSPALWWWAEPQNPDLRLHVLISRNRDGRFIADIVRPWRIFGIAGSSSRKGKDKGGAAAYRQMLRLLRDGSLIAITPDGPRGPRREVQPGVIRLAAHSGVKIVPVGMTCAGIRLRSWDRLLFPMPFGRGVFCAAAPIDAKGREETSVAQELAEKLNNVTARAESLRSRSLADRLWHGVTDLISPALILSGRLRIRKGKEDPKRIRERMGMTDHPRPDGPIIWIHAASVGETLSILPLAERILGASSVHILLTTGTLTSAELVRRKAISPCLIHQFVPLDVSRWTGRFLRHWRPDILVLTESEIWPGMIAGCHSRGIPVVTVNGRLSEKASENWSRFPGVAQGVFGRLSWVAARTDQDARRFRQAGAHDVFCAGDLKMAAPPPAADPILAEKIRQATADRPVLLAASTHEGEDATLCEAASLLRQIFPDLLLIIVPRHPIRGEALARLAGNAPRLAQSQFPTPQDTVWIADTLGDLGTFFALFPIVFIGNSLSTGPGGGHNPFEPAKCGAVIASGPRTQNFQDAFELLKGDVCIADTPQDLAAWVTTMLTNDSLRQDTGARLKAAASASEALPEQLSRKILRTARLAT